MRKLILIGAATVAAVACSSGADMIGEILDSGVPDAGAQPGGVLVDCDLVLPSGTKYAIVPVANPRTAVVEYCVDEPPLGGISNHTLFFSQELSRLATCVAQSENYYVGNNLYIGCGTDTPTWDSIRVYE